MNLEQASSRALAIAEMVVRWALLILIASTLAAEFGVRSPLPRVAPQTLLYLAGAWLAYRWR